MKTTRLGASLAAIVAVTFGWWAAPARADDSLEIVDANGGAYASLVLDAAGNPVIAYGSGSLRLVHCDDPNCEGNETPQIIDPVSVLHPSVALDAAGNPVIAYSGSGDLRLVHCDDPNCEGDETPQIIDPGGPVGVWYTSLALDAAGNPVISYHDWTTGELRLVHCDDPNCEGDETPQTVDGGLPDRQTGRYTSLVLDAVGNPIISYQDWMTANSGIGVLRLVHCDDPNCEGDETPQTVDATGNTVQFTSLVLDAVGNPVISYHDWTAGELRLVHCDDPNCEGDETLQTVDAGSDVGSAGRYASLVLDAVGNPVISYTHDPFVGPEEFSAGELRLVHCDDPNCAGDETPQTVDATTGLFTSLALDTVGNPVIAYSGSGGLRLVHCDDPNCEDPDATTTTTGTTSTTLAPTTTTGTTSTTLAPTTTTSTVGGGPPSTLPSTGGGTDAWMMGIAAVVVLAGASLIKFTRHTRLR